MSTALLLRLFVALFGGLAMTYHVWDWSGNESRRQPDGEAESRPRFSSFTGALVALPTLLLLSGVIGYLDGGAQSALQLVLRAILFVFPVIAVYDVVLLALLPVLRRHVSARVCASLWLLPDWLYFLYNPVFREADHVLVIHASGTVVRVCFAVWAVGAAGVFLWKIFAHLRFRRQILKPAVPVTDAPTLAVWNEELERARIRKPKIRLVRSPALKTPLSIGLFPRSICVVLPERACSQEELALIFRHELIHITRNDMSAKLFLTFCTALCWFNPLMWLAMRKSADDFELSCDESVLLDAQTDERRQYAQLLLKTAGDERGFTTCLSATASALRYRLKNVMKPGKKRTGAVLTGLVFAALVLLSSGTVALAYDAQPGAERLFQERSPEAYTLQYVRSRNDPRGSAFRCTDEAALKTYLSALVLETYTESADWPSDVRELTVGLDTPEGALVLRLGERFLRVTKLYEQDAPGETYYLQTKPDWEIIDTLIVPFPELCVQFEPERSALVQAQWLTETLPDGQERLLKEDRGETGGFGAADCKEVRLSFNFPVEDYTITITDETGTHTCSRSELPDDVLPLSGADVRCTVTARLRGENGAFFTAGFCFTYENTTTE